MSQEIVEAVRSLAREKGIAEDKLLRALEDALLSAYKKQPDAARYARVTMNPDDGVTVAAETGVVSIAYADIHRSNLLGD